LIEAIVLVGLVTACLLAGSPTLISPPSTKAMIDGVVLFPSALGITTASLPSITETQELVVPKSIPIILPIFNIFNFIVYSIILLVVDKSIFVPIQNGLLNCQFNVKIGGKKSDKMTFQWVCHYGGSFNLGALSRSPLYLYVLKERT
jgi:hypothetical protein